jgi:hypothetical protein
MKDIFFSEDLAIGTYRHAVGTTIPEMTKVAWEKKHDEITKVIPSARKETVVFHLSGKEYDKTFGTDYEKPHGFARFLGWIYKLIPKVGPFRAFSFSVPTREAERLFLESFTSTRVHFRQSLDALRGAKMVLVNSDFDTGLPTRRGEYSLADETYDQLLGKLADRKFVDVPEGLRSNILDYYGDVGSIPESTGAQQTRTARIREQLGRLGAVAHP